MGILRTELGSHSLLHTPSAAQSHRQAKPWTALRVWSLGGGTASASSAAVCPGRAGLIMKLMPSPAVRAALFLSFCCFSQLAQSWARRVRSCLAPRSRLRAGCEVGVGKDGASGLFRSWSWEHRTFQCSHSGRRAGHTAGAGAWAECHRPGPAAGLPDTRCPLVFTFQSRTRARIRDLMNDLSPIWLPSC